MPYGNAYHSISPPQLLSLYAAASAAVIAIRSADRLPPYIAYSAPNAYSLPDPIATYFEYWVTDRSDETSKIP